MEDGPSQIPAEKRKHRLEIPEEDVPFQNLAKVMKLEETLKAFSGDKNKKIEDLKKGIEEKIEEGSPATSAPLPSRLGEPTVVEPPRPAGSKLLRRWKEIIGKK